MHVTAHDLPFESEQHPLSQRWAVMEDDGEAAWLYLSEPGTTKPAAACFLYDRRDVSVQDAEPSVHFRWSVNGNSVAALIEGRVIGFIAESHPLGFSSAVTSVGPRGNPMNLELYEKTFRAT